MQLTSGKNGLILNACSRIYLRSYDSTTAKWQKLKGKGSQVDILVLVKFFRGKKSIGLPASDFSQ